MTITPSTIYWIGNCDSMVIACIVMTIISIGLGLILSSALLSIENAKAACWMLGIFLVLGFFGLAGAAFIPSSKTAAAMYVVPAIANNEKIQSLGSEIYDLAVEWMKELKPKKEKESK